MQAYPGCWQAWAPKFMRQMESAFMIRLLQSLQNSAKFLNQKFRRKQTEKLVSTADVGMFGAVAETNIGRHQSQPKILEDQTIELQMGLRSCPHPCDHRGKFGFKFQSWPSPHFLTILTFFSTPL